MGIFNGEEAEFDSASLVQRGKSRGNHSDRKCDDEIVDTDKNENYSYNDDDDGKDQEEEEEEDYEEDEQDPDGYAWRYDPEQLREMTEIRHETWAPTHKLGLEELGVTLEMARSVAEIHDAGEGGVMRATFGEAMWEGAWEGGLPNGQGAMLWSDGTKYVGSVSFGQVTGSGRYEWADGGVYTGDVLRGKRHGKGTYRKGPVKYAGEWEQGHRHGVGTLWFDEEGISRYEGDWVRGCKHGRGRMMYRSGAVYEGGWEEDLRHGRGRMEWAGEGGVYEGEWHRGAQVMFDMERSRVRTLP